MSCKYKTLFILHRIQRFDLLLITKAKKASVPSIPFEIKMQSSSETCALKLRDYPGSLWIQPSEAFTSSIARRHRLTSIHSILSSLSSLCCVRRWSRSHPKTEVARRSLDSSGVESLEEEGCAVLSGSMDGGKGWWAKVGPGRRRTMVLALSGAIIDCCW